MFCIGRNLHITNGILVQDNGKTIHKKRKIEVNHEINNNLKYNEPDIDDTAEIQFYLKKPTTNPASHPQEKQSDFKAKRGN